MTNVQLYRQAIRESWHFAWHNKMLWIFGFFAAFLGQMGLMELTTKVGLAGTSYAFFPSWLILPGFLNSPFSLKGLILPIEGWVWLVWLFCILIGFSVLLLFISVASQGTLVAAAAKMSKRGKETDTTKAWHSGVSHFWSLFIINLLKKAIIMVLAVLLAFATFNVIVQATLLDYILFIVLFVLSVVVGLVLSFLVIYTAGYLVVEKQRLGKALSLAWSLFIGHWLVSIEVGLIILAINVVLGLVVLSSFFLLFIPTLLLWLVAVSVVSLTLYYVAMFIGVALFVLFIVFLGSLFNVFVTTTWTYLFMKMHKKGVTSRLLYWGRMHK